MSTTNGQDERARRSLQAVIETQRRINEADLALSDVMAMVVQRAQELTDATGAVVELAEGDEMVYCAVSGSAEGSLGLRLGVQGSLSGLCVRTGEVLRCDDTEHDPRVDIDACRKVNVRSMVVAPLSHRGKTVGVLKVLSSRPHSFDERDVGNLQLMAGFVAASLTHAQEFEDKLDRIRELSRLNEALDAFSSHVAHDLSNPIAVITMASEELERVLGDEVADARELVSAVREQAAVSGDLVQDLLALARTSRTPQREPVALGELVDATARSITGITLDNRCHGVTLVADRRATRQALANLLSNGARYAGNGDGPTELTVWCEDEERGWRVVVADRGPGLEDGDHHRVFRAFERGRRTGRSGSGLGLAIVAAMAQAHGGEAGYDARPGGGSQFWFTLRRPS
jgi:signal transduction histidine kinase